MQEVMRCIKNFIVCFVVFTMVFGLSFLMIFSGNIELAFILGMSLAAIITICMLIDDKINRKYRIPQIQKDVAREQNVILSMWAFTDGSKWKRPGSADDSCMAGVLFLLEKEVYFRDIGSKIPYEIRIAYKKIEDVHEENKGIGICLKDGKKYKFRVKQKEVWIMKIRELKESSWK